MIQGKNVLITGGAGSVGNFLTRRILQEDPAVIRVFDNNEANLSELKRSIDDDRCRYLSGDVRERKRLDRAIDNIDIVIHTAGLKHVELMEYNPFEAVKTNVVGLQNVVDAAIDSNVERVVFTSSDKAVNPANTMGTTKLLGEKLITAGNKHKGGSDLKLASVRFGNVINSSQSVIPLFRKQIRNGGPVTVTDERMTRFFLTWEQLGDLILEAVNKTNGGEVFLYKMDVMSIEMLAEVLIDELAPVFGYDPTDIEMEFIGKRLGETLDEDVMTEREAVRAVEGSSTYAIPPETTEGNGYLSKKMIDGYEEATDVVRSSGDADLLDPEGVKRVLAETGALEEVK